MDKIYKFKTVWFVDPKNGDDSKSGLSMEEAVKDENVLWDRMNKLPPDVTIKSGKDGEWVVEDAS